MNGKWLGKKMIINKRNIRDLRKNFLRHFGIFIFIFISSMVMVGISSSVDSVILAVSKLSTECNVEDGYVECSQPLSAKSLNEISVKGIDIENQSYYDANIDNNKVLRIFSNRDKINLLKLVQGKEPLRTGEIVLSKGFADKNDYNIGENLKIADKNYLIVGYATTPDYVNAIRELSDTVSDYSTFGLGYMSKSDAKDYIDTSGARYNYSYRLNGQDKDYLSEIIKKNSIIVSMVEREDNARITSYQSDIKIIKNISIIIAVVLVILVAFLISNYISSVIESECVIIGTLFSLGYSRSELCRHYISLPAIVVTLGSIVGTLCGFFFGGIFIQSVIQAYNFPSIEKVFYLYHLLLGIVFPISFVLISNIRVLLDRLSIEPLKLLRKDIKKKKHISYNISYNKIKRLNFFKRFKIKEMLSNMSNFFVLALGVILTVFLMMFSLGIWSSLGNYIENISDDINYNYCYYINSTDGLQIFKDAEETSNTEMALVLDNDNSNKIILSGIDSNSKFYDFSIPNNETGIYVSTNISQKFGINVEDEITLMDPSSKKTYSSKVKGVVENKNGLYVFMNRSKMNEMLGKNSDYYNVILSKEKLNIDESYIYKEVTKDGLSADVKSIMNRLIPLCIIIMVISIGICIVLILILIKIQFDRSFYSVVLVGCVGYNPNEISSIYMFPIKAALTFGVIVGIPISYFIFKGLWPILIRSMKTYINVHYYWYCYLLIGMIYVICYFISILLFKVKLKKVDYATAMKARE